MAHNYDISYSDEEEDGGEYEGDRDENGRPHGKGVLKDSFGVYSGSFEHGVMSGEGELVCENGDKFVGKFKDGNFAEGLLVHEDGSRFNGSFLNGQKHGKGELVNSEGTIQVSGIWEKGEVNGYIQKGHLDKGTVIEGLFTNGNWSGLVKTTNKDGTVSKKYYPLEKRLRVQLSCKKYYAKNKETIKEHKNKYYKEIVVQREKTRINKCFGGCERMFSTKSNLMKHRKICKLVSPL